MRLAIAPLRRGPGRALLLVAVTAVLIFAVEFLATLSSTLQAATTGALAHDQADVFVYAADAGGSLDTSRLPRSLIARAVRIPGVAAVADLGVFDFTVPARPAPYQLALIGVGPARPGRGTPAAAGWPATLGNDRPPGPGQGLADSTAAGTGLVPGGRIALQPGDSPLRIMGLVSGVRYDGVATVWSTYRTWAAAVAAAEPGGGGPVPNALAVRAGPGTSAAVLARRLTAALPGTTALTRAAAAGDVPGASVIAATFDVLTGLAFAVTVLVIGAVFLLLTVQRLPVAIAARALGASTARLGGALLVQVTLVVLAASALAWTGLLLVSASSAATLGVRAGPGLAGATALAVELGALASTLLPVRRIARLDPAAALARA